jgi:hypothetical protein
MTGELFELELLGGTTEQRFRRMRPEVEAMPWGTVDLSQVNAERCIAARKAWTGSAYQEHRTGAACALTLQALIEARAPLDLIAVASATPSWTGRARAFRPKKRHAWASPQIWRFGSCISNGSTCRSAATNRAWQMTCSVGCKPARI